MLLGRFKFVGHHSENWHTHQPVPPGFVLGKPFWAVPEVLPDPKGGGARGDSGDPADEFLLSINLSSQLVQIPGMDGFFIYQLHYKHVSGAGVVSAAFKSPMPEPASLSPRYW